MWSKTSFSTKKLAPQLVEDDFIFLIIYLMSINIFVAEPSTFIPITQLCGAKYASEWNVDTCNVI